MPILDGVLSSLEGSGLSAQEIKALSDFRWQIHLLTSEHQRIKDLFPLTFTVTDVSNHKIVVENIGRAQEGYRFRLGHVLDYLRKVLQILDRPTTRKRNSIFAIEKLCTRTARLVTQLRIWRARV